MERTGKPYGKILLAVTEDWFVLSHFKPLIRALRSCAAEVVVAARDNGRLKDVAALGVRTIDFDHARKSSDPRVVVATAKRLRALIDAEKPHAVHLIALKPIVLGAIALRQRPDLAVGVHLTGLGHLGVATSLKGRVLRGGVLTLLRSLLRRDRMRLFVENEDDLSQVGASAAGKTVLLGGAGVDPAHFTALPHRDGPPVAAYVGRLVRSKGVDVLIEAARHLRAARAPVQLRLYGGIDTENPDAYTRDEIETWQRDGLASWGGHVQDVRDVWRDADIAIAPSRGGEGLPRAVLEAAASARALIVTDVPGNRRFVRDGIEGRVVAPGDAAALAHAIGDLAGDAARRRDMGEAARRRVLDGYTEADVEVAVATAYRALIPDRR
jgi:glycosyltransferase involved in cell wall biosynthesis